MGSHLTKKRGLIIALTCAAVLSGCGHHKDAKSASSTSSTVSTTTTTLDVSASLNAADSDLSSVNTQLNDANQSAGIAQKDTDSAEGNG